MIRSGTKLRVVKPFYTRGLFKHFALSKFYEVDMVLKVIEPTGKNPWGYEDPSGFWLVDCPYFCPPMDESVWGNETGLAMLLEKGWLEII